MLEYLQTMFTRFNPQNLFQRTDRCVRQQSNPGMTLPNIPDAKYNREDERLQSFENRWPLEFIDYHLLARTGMYYVGLRDATKCQFCDISVTAWQQGDDPVNEHLKWSPNCPLLRRLTTRNVPIDIAALDSVLPATSPDVCGLVRQVPLNCQASCTARQILPAFPHFAQEAMRVASFSEWPKVIKHKVNKLAEAGFFYIGRGDQVQCFSCGGGLKDWEDADDPWVEHAVWHSNCKYLKLIRGKQFIDDCIGSYVAHQKEPKNQLEPASSSYDRQISIASSNGGDMDENNFCKLCFIEERNAVFLPCGHVVACAKCASSLTKCPVCRLPFTDVHRLYFS